MEMYAHLWQNRIGRSAIGIRWNCHGDGVYGIVILEAAETRLRFHSEAETYSTNERVRQGSCIRIVRNLFGLV